jgi:hypothetical protein
MRRVSNFDEYLMECVDSIVKEGSNPLGQTIISNSCIIEITANHVFEYYNYTGRSFTVIINGGYRDGKAKVQPARN